MHIKLPSFSKSIAFRVTTLLNWVVILFLLGVNYSFAQVNELSALRYSIGMNTYIGGEIVNHSGPIRVEPYPISTFTFGVDYKMAISNALVATAGFRILNQPLSRLRYTIPENTVNFSFAPEINSGSKHYSIPTFDIPLSIEFHIPLSKKNSLSPLIGYKYLFFPKGYAENRYILVNDSNESIVAFYAIYSSDKNPNYHNLFAGVSFNSLSSIGQFCLQAGYNYSTRNISQGVYIFPNMKPGYESEGEYINKGHYCYLSLSYSPYKRIRDQRKPDFKDASEKNYRKTSEYFPLSISIQGNFFGKAIVTLNEGPDYWDQYSSYSTSLSLETLLPLTNDLSLRSGVGLIAIPAVNSRLNLGPEHFINGLSFPSVNYRKTAVNLPLQLDYHLDLQNNWIFHLIGGFQFAFLEEDLERIITNGNNPWTNPESALFNITIRTNGFLHEQVVFGTGISKMAQKGMWSLLLRYNLPFTPIFTGEYSFQNLNNSPDANGTYEVSGRYLSLSMAYFPKFHKKEKG